jgi:CRP/FNR family nitrogen fixation transcriptional regulator
MLTVSAAIAPAHTMAAAMAASADNRLARSGALALPTRGPVAPATEARSAASGVALTGQVLNFAEGREIYAEGEAVRSFYKVIDGVVRTCTFASDGRRQIDGFHAAGEIFGLEMSDEHRLSAEAVTDCTVVAYRWAGLASFNGGDGETARAVFGLAMQCLERTRDHSLLLGRRSAAQKLAAFLLDLAERGGSDGGVDLAMSRQDIADYVGLTIETVSRTLSQFERDHLIALPSTRHVVLRNRPALVDMAD